MSTYSPGTPPQCSQCSCELTLSTGTVDTDDGAFCRSCYEQLVEHVQAVVGAQSEDINYPMALIGGMIGGLGGAMIWWGFTVVTNIAFGLVAIVIGIGVGKGILIATGQKRSVSLQVISVGISICSIRWPSNQVPFKLARSLSKNRPPSSRSTDA